MVILRLRGALRVLNAGLLALGVTLLSHPATGQQPSFLPPESRQLAPSDPGVLPFGAWQEGRGTLWQAMHQSKMAGMPHLSTASTMADNGPRHEQPQNSANNQNANMQYVPGRNNEPAGASNPLRGFQPGWNDPSSPAQGLQYQSGPPSWSVPQSQPSRDTLTPIPMPERGPAASQFSPESAGWGSTAGTPQPPAPSRTVAGTEFGPPGGTYGVSSSSRPGYAEAQSSLPVAGAMIPGAQPPTQPLQAQVPSEDPNLMIERLRQQYHIGSSRLNYTGSHNLSTLSEAPHWTGPTGVVPPSSASRATGRTAVAR